MVCLDSNTSTVFSSPSSQQKIWEYFGFEDSDVKSLLLLNRVFRVGTDQTGQYLDIEPDLRHAPLIICGQYTHKHCTYGAAQHSHALGSRSMCDLYFIFVSQKESCHLVPHVSSLVVSPAFHQEHIIFLIHSSLYDTRTRSSVGTTRAIPRTRRRRESPSKTGLL